MTTAREVLDLDMSEDDWQSQVTKAATKARWLWYHTRDSRRSPKGFPDLTIVRGATLLFLELKTEKGIVSPQQEEWIGRLKQVKYVFANVARPRHWADVSAVLGARER